MEPSLAFTPILLILYPTLASLILLLTQVRRDSNEVKLNGGDQDWSPSLDFMNLVSECKRAGRLKVTLT